MAYLPGGAGGYILEEPYGYGGGYDGYGGGYGVPIIEQPVEYGYAPQYVEEVYYPQPQPQPVLIEEEFLAPAYLDPVGGYLDPIYGYGDPYGDPYGGAVPIIDDLVGAGYYGPWPQDYYLPQPPSRRCRKPKRRCQSDSDSDSDDDRHHHKHIHKHCYRQPMRQNNGITKDDIQSLLDKFESALNLKYKRAQITELDAENQLLKGLAREKRAIQKQVAQAKRDLLLKEALDFNRDAPVPGQRHGRGQQVVSIDFGQNGGQAGRPIAPQYALPPNPRPALLPTSRPKGAAAYSGGAVIYH